MYIKFDIVDTKQTPQEITLTFKFTHKDEWTKIPDLLKRFITSGDVLLPLDANTKELVLTLTTNNVTLFERFSNRLSIYASASASNILSFEDEYTDNMFTWVLNLSSKSNKEDPFIKLTACQVDNRPHTFDLPLNVPSLPLFEYQGNKKLARFRVAKGTGEIFDEANLDHQRLGQETIPLTTLQQRQLVIIHKRKNPQENPKLFLLPRDSSEEADILTQALFNKAGGKASDFTHLYGTTASNLSAFNLEAHERQGCLVPGAIYLKNPQVKKALTAFRSKVPQKDVLAPMSVESDEKILDISSNNSNLSVNTGKKRKEPEPQNLAQSEEKDANPSPLKKICHNQHDMLLTKDEKINDLEKQLNTSQDHVTQLTGKIVELTEAQEKQLALLAASESQIQKNIDLLAQSLTEISDLRKSLVEKDEKIAELIQNQEKSVELLTHLKGLLTANANVIKGFNADVIKELLHKKDDLLAQQTQQHTIASSSAVTLANELSPASENTFNSSSSSPEISNSTPSQKKRLDLDKIHDALGNRQFDVIKAYAGGAVFDYEPAKLMFTSIIDINLFYYIDGRPCESTGSELSVLRSNKEVCTKSNFQNTHSLKTHPFLNNLAMFYNEYSSQNNDHQITDEKPDSLMASAGSKGSVSPYYFSLVSDSNDQSATAIDLTLEPLEPLLTSSNGTNQAPAATSTNNNSFFTLDSSNPAANAPLTNGTSESFNLFSPTR